MATHMCMSFELECSNECCKMPSSLSTATTPSRRRCRIRRYMKHISIAVLLVLIPGTRGNIFRMQGIDVTASDDDKGVIIDWFSLVISPTSGELSSDTLIATRDAALLYLDKMLSLQYDNFEPSNNNLELEIEAHGSVLGSNQRHRRLQSQGGSYVTFSGFINFEYQPSPSKASIESTILETLSDSSLNDLLIEMIVKSNDPALAGVISASGSVSVTLSPSTTPSKAPTLSPTRSPSSLPTNIPTLFPTVSPSNTVTISPSTITISPSLPPTSIPTSQPTLMAGTVILNVNRKRDGEQATTLIITSVVLGATLISTLALFAFRRRRRCNPNEPKLTKYSEEINNFEEKDDISMDYFVDEGSEGSNYPTATTIPSPCNSRQEVGGFSRNTTPQKSPHNVHNSMSATEVLGAMASSGHAAGDDATRHRDKSVTLGIRTSRQQDGSPSRSALATAKAVSEFLKIRQGEKDESDFSKDMLPLPYPWDPSDEHSPSEELDDFSEYDDHCNDSSVRDNRPITPRKDGHVSSITSPMSNSEFEQDWEELPYHWDPVTHNPEGVVIGPAVVSPQNALSPNASKHRHLKSPSPTLRNFESRVSTPSMTPQHSPSTSQNSNLLSGAFPRLNSHHQAAPNRDYGLQATPVSQSSEKWQYTGRVKSCESSQQTPTHPLDWRYAGTKSLDSSHDSDSIMHPLDWSNKSEIDSAISSQDSTLSEQDDTDNSTKNVEFSTPRLIWGQNNNSKKEFDDMHRLEQEDVFDVNPPTINISYNSPHLGSSNIDHQSVSVGTGTSTVTNDSSSSRQFINDLVWLEKRIAQVRGTDAASQVPSSAASVRSATMSPIMQSIICRDCFAPPGTLHIIIHSTKDGPAVHSVQEGSSLEGQLFPGDLIVAVDNKDTRSLTADQVMRMMQGKSGFERKITVLHFEDTA